MAVIVLRAMALNHLPKTTFLVLWAVAVLRLLVPFSIPSPVSIYTLTDSPPLQPAGGTAALPSISPNLPAVSTVPSIPDAAPNAASSTVPTGGASVQIWPWVWLAGAAACGAFFLLSYLRCRREFRTALPIEDANLHAWLAGRCLRRTVALCQSDRIHAPLTYGLFRPVILLPKTWKAEPQLAYVLEHELAHIRYLDALWKPLLALAACVHWFNPLVWCMFVLANRDMELRCDEAVVRQLGLDSRSGYALTLISLEEKKSGLGPFASAFSKNAIEERIRAIMKIRKRSLAAIVAAVLLVCCITTGFATSAAKEKDSSKTSAGTGMTEDNIAYVRKQAQSVTAIMDAMDELLPELTDEEKLWLANQYIADYSDLAVTEYRQRIRMKWGHIGETNGTALDGYTELQYDADSPVVALSGFKADSSSLAVSPENWTALDHYIELRSSFYHPADALSDFDEYFFNIYLPLIKDGWEDGHEFSGEASNGLGRLEYNYTIRVTDPDALTVGEYVGEHVLVGASVEVQLKRKTNGLAEEVDIAEVIAAANEQLHRMETHQMTIIVGGDYAYIPYDALTDSDDLLHAQFSSETAVEWDRLLSPYVPFGLTYQFDDPDHDGNGLTMWFQGKEVRGIYDEQEHIWLTEHAGPGFSDGAVELYTVYTNGVLSGLREANPDEQEGFDKLREGNGIYAKSFRSSEETREFPRATRTDYDSILALRQWDNTSLPPWASYPYLDYQDESLASFNQRLLDWANENPDAWDRINCDVIWNDYGVNLTTDERIFVSLTCLLSGTENGMMIRALHTSGSEEDPSFFANMPELTAADANGYTTAWCDLSYNISYHVADKTAINVAQRDSCVSGMMNAIDNFWLTTDFDTLLQMTEEEVAAQFNTWANENSTKDVQITPVTTDNIFFEHGDERGIN